MNIKKECVNMSKLYIFMYHYTRDLQNSRYPKINGLDITMFRHQIEFMKKNFNVVTMEQVIDAAEKKSSLPENALLLTFDDGYIDNYTFALPILEEFGVQGSFFIPGKTFSTHQLLDVNKIHYMLASSDINELVEDIKKEMDYYRGGEFDYAPTDELFYKYAVANRYDAKETIFVKRMLQTVLPERLRNIISSNLFEKYVGVTEETLAHELYMTEEQIYTMKRHGMFIGVHGYDHYWLGNLTQEQLERDITKALEVLDGFIDKKHWVMNYPYGNYNQGVIELIKSKGACLGLTTKYGRADLLRNSLYELPRFDCTDFPPKSENY